MLTCSYGGNKLYTYSGHSVLYVLSSFFVHVKCLQTYKLIVHAKEGQSHFYICKHETSGYFKSDEGQYNAMS